MSIAVSGHAAQPRRCLRPGTQRKCRVAEVADAYLCQLLLLKGVMLLLLLPLKRVKFGSQVPRDRLLEQLLELLLPFYKRKNKVNLCEHK